MSANVLTVGLIPVIVFVIIDGFSRDLRSSVVGAVAASYVELLAMYYSTGRWDGLSLVATSLFVIFGYLSIRYKDRLYFKLQPAVVCLIAAGFVGYLQFFGEPMVYRYLPLLKETAPPMVQPFLADQNFLKVLNYLCNGLMWVILIEGALIAYTALKCGNTAWLIMNAFGVWIVGAVVIVLQLLHLRWKGWL